ncbi:Hypothetical protein NTJ_08546 [Nesidiocoris tenuis]|uniref:Galactose mutarotase n=1 Tax=Nesidiocoris tenuis TaxID=355587 RepID=A0ABN7AZ00_9HEMI|nr:Hypothetical protein NTJ_08546 [Nesidiocoris tenuis]
MEPGVSVEKSDYADLVLPQCGMTKIIKYKLCNGFMSVEIINYGATIVGIYLPDSNGKKSNVILGYDSITGYLNGKNGYLGATIGRYGHRIANATFNLKEQTYCLSKNDGNHSYHGGVQGFDKKVWDSRVEGNTVLMTYRSCDLEQGFPGDLDVSVQFVLTNRNQFMVAYNAVPIDKTTPINIMNQLYFNLSDDPDSGDASRHAVKVDSEFVLNMSHDSIPTGDAEQITDGPLDVRKYVPIDELSSLSSKRASISGKSAKSREGVTIATQDGTKDTTFRSDSYTVGTYSSPNTGVYYCIEGLGLRPHAKIKYEPSGRSVQIFSNQPCLYLSLGQELADSAPKIGKAGCHVGILAQTGNFPDAVHQEKFPTPWVSPGETYQHTIVYKFRVSGLDCSDEEDGLPKKEEESLDRKCFEQNAKAVEG